MKNKLLYNQAGKIDDTVQAWEFIPSENSGQMVYNEAEGYYPDKGGKLFGPTIERIKEFSYYELTFTASAKEDCHWGVMFYDQNNEAIVSDVYSSIYAGEDLKYEQVVYGRENCAYFRPFFQSVNGVEIFDLKIQEISSDDAANWCDRLYSTLPQLEYTPLVNRLQLLPKTIHAMYTGKSYRIVMLGDSIINDTYNSNFQALIKRNYPESNLDFICSVRGSTGCWYYQAPEQFDKYVAALKPDLLIIGGISQNEDINAIRKVVEMTREQIGGEIAIASSPFGKKELIHKDNEFAEKQMQLAKAMNIEFIDIRRPWIKYLDSCKKTTEYFYRDIIHANDRGKQIVSRILERHFSV